MMAVFLEHPHAEASRSERSERSMPTASGFTLPSGRTRLRLYLSAPAQSQNLCYRHGGRAKRVLHC